MSRPQNRGPKPPLSNDGKGNREANTGATTAPPPQKSRSLLALEKETRELEQHVARLKAKKMAEDANFQAIKEQRMKENGGSFWAAARPDAGGAKDFAAQVLAKAEQAIQRRNSARAGVQTPISGDASVRSPPGSAAKPKARPAVKPLSVTQPASARPAAGATQNLDGILSVNFVPQATSTSTIPSKQHSSSVPRSAAQASALSAAPKDHTTLKPRSVLLRPSSSTPTPTSPTCTPPPAVASEEDGAPGSLLRGRYDESSALSAFQEARLAWLRGDGAPTSATTTASTGASTDDTNAVQSGAVVSAGSGVGERVLSSKYVKRVFREHTAEGTVIIPTVVARQEGLLPNVHKYSRNTASAETISQNGTDSGTGTGAPGSLWGAAPLDEEENRREFERARRAFLGLPDISEDNAAADKEKTKEMASTGGAGRVGTDQDAAVSAWEEDRDGEKGTFEVYRLVGPASRTDTARGSTHDTAVNRSANPSISADAAATAGTAPGTSTGEDASRGELWAASLRARDEAAARREFQEARMAFLRAAAAGAVSDAEANGSAAAGLMTTSQLSSGVGAGADREGNTEDEDAGVSGTRLCVEVVNANEREEEECAGWLLQGEVDEGQNRRDFEAARQAWLRAQKGASAAAGATANATATVGGDDVGVGVDAGVARRTPAYPIASRVPKREYEAVVLPGATEAAGAANGHRSASRLAAAMAFAANRPLGSVLRAPVHVTHAPASGNGTRPQSGAPGVDVRVGGAADTAGEDGVDVVAAGGDLWDVLAARVDLTRLHSSATTSAATNAADSSGDSDNTRAGDGAAPAGASTTSPSAPVPAETGSELLNVLLSAPLSVLTSVAAAPADTRAAAGAVTSSAAAGTILAPDSGISSSPAFAEDALMRMVQRAASARAGVRSRPTSAVHAPHTPIVPAGKTTRPTLAPFRPTSASTAPSPAPLPVSSGSHSESARAAHATAPPTNATARGPMATAVPHVTTRRATATATGTDATAGSTSLSLPRPGTGARKPAACYHCYRLFYPDVAPSLSSDAAPVPLITAHGHPLCSPACAAAAAAQEQRHDENKLALARERLARAMQRSHSAVQGQSQAAENATPLRAVSAHGEEGGEVESTARGRTGEHVSNARTYAQTGDGLHTAKTTTAVPEGVSMTVDNNAYTYAATRSGEEEDLGGEGESVGFEDVVIEGELVVAGETAWGRVKDQRRPEQEQRGDMPQEKLGYAEGEDYDGGGDGDEDGAYYADMDVDANAADSLDGLDSRTQDMHETSEEHTSGNTSGGTAAIAGVYVVEEGCYIEEPDDDE